MSNDNLGSIRNLYAAFAKGDIPTVLGSFDSDIIWEEPDVPGHPWGGKHQGPDGVLNGVFMQIGGTTENFSIVAEDYHAAGDRVLAIGKFNGTTKATGKPFKSDFVHIYTLNNGKITHFKTIEDSSSVLSSVK